MKKQISFEKFRIAELRNPDLIVGGTDGDDGTDTGKVEVPKCVENSSKFILDPEEPTIKDSNG